MEHTHGTRIDFYFECVYVYVEVKLELFKNIIVGTRDRVSDSNQLRNDRKIQK